MNAFVSHHPAALALEALGRSLAFGARAARRTAAGLDRWIAHRRRAACDLDALSAMSERELSDIGLSRGFLMQVAAGSWSRDRAG
jgi:uncharacterized protein YjiS (DUF1127 family)